MRGCWGLGEGSAVAMDAGGDLGAGGPWRCAAACAPDYLEGSTRAAVTRIERDALVGVDL